MSHSLKTHLNEITYLKSIKSLLSWDQETLMPKSATPFRAEQSALIESLIQDRILDEKIRSYLMSTPSNPTEKRHQELLFDEVEKNSLPKDLVERLAKHTVLSIESWKKARDKKDFSLFQSDLKEMIRLNQEVADHLKKGKSRYDTLLSFYDKDLTFKEIEELFDPIEKELTKILKEKKTPQISPIPLPASIEEQKKICGSIVDLIAPKTYLAESTHPFCDMIAPTDIRLTTRYNPQDLFEALFSTLHELGHALYDLQLPHEKLYPLNQALSLTVHESQSKLFETCIGGSKDFLTLLFKKCQNTLKDMPFTLDEMIRSRHAVSPNPIRIESDEFTYPLHIIFRTKIEKELIEGELQVEDLPKVFRDYQRKLLDLNVEDDAQGCLQDIHWASGSFGYFPTYLTGCMYAADQYECLKKEIPLQDCLLKGDLKPLRDWLKRAVHTHGSLYNLPNLLKQSTKKPLSSKRYLDYLKERFLDS
ncbi:MAG: carboxypeptidase M32 [Chlamydiae bacterium]|nr:carboxypeptidase M32 [Chlamydiota bacterium]